GAEFAIAERTVGCGMDYAAGSGGTLGFGNIPGLRSGGDEHLASGCAATAQRIPIDRRGIAATGALRAEFRFFEVGLFDANVLPIHIELVSENHREMRFDALADFGILREDGDNAIRRDAEKSERSKGWSRSGGRGTLGKRGSERLCMEGEKNAASC